ncbi:hypothetical protein AAVH_13606 [Aphelenchoides avenae]|nr:hypothetical protein AAVH_13606 [Aphelenchus avenae]
MKHVVSHLLVSYPVVICGDFNLPKINWKENSATSPHAEEFLRLCKALSLHQLVTEVTTDYPPPKEKNKKSKENTLIDLVLTADLLNVSAHNFHQAAASFKSDHKMIRFEVTFDNAAPLPSKKWSEMEKLPRLLEHLDGLLLTDALELFRYAKADLDAKKWANADRFVPNFASIGTANGGGAKRVWPSKFEAYCPDDDWADPVYEYMLRMALGTLTVRNASEYVLHSYTPLITKNLQLLASDIIYCEKIPGNWSTGKPPVPDTLQLLFRRMMSSRHQMWLKSWDPVVAESTKEQLDLCKVEEELFPHAAYDCCRNTAAGIDAVLQACYQGSAVDVLYIDFSRCFSKSKPSKLIDKISASNPLFDYCYADFTIYHAIP